MEGYKPLGTTWDREQRNEENRMFKELYESMAHRPSFESERQVMERGKKEYNHEAISLSDRDVIFETSNRFVLDHFYYIYKPSNPSNVKLGALTPVIFLKTGDSWTGYTGVATVGGVNTSGRADPSPSAIINEENNAHLPHYNVLQYDTKNGVYAFEINKEIIAPEGLQIAIYGSNKNAVEGETSFFSYQLRGRETL